jgi:uncharacterized protein YkwD
MLTQSKIRALLAGGVYLIILLPLLNANRAMANPSLLSASPTPDPNKAFLPALLQHPATQASPEWLVYLNGQRALADLPLLTEEPAWSDGDWKHARYTVKNDVLGHSEDPSNAYYTPEGADAAGNSNVMASSSANTPDQTAIDMWMSGPFHAIGILDSRLRKTGFGSYRESGGSIGMAAALDVLHGLDYSSPPPVTFPVRWPANNKTMSSTSFMGGEYPDPLTACPGYSIPAGQPIYLMISTGNQVPTVTDHRLTQGGKTLENCEFDETNYTNSDSSQQQLARSILNGRDAIVIIPRSTLIPGASYTISITVNNQIYSWTFNVASTAP